MDDDYLGGVLPVGSLIGRNDSGRFEPVLTEQRHAQLMTLLRVAGRRRTHPRGHAHGQAHPRRPGRRVRRPRSRPIGAVMDLYSPLGIVILLLVLLAIVYLIRRL